MTNAVFPAQIWIFSHCMPYVDLCRWERHNQSPHSTMHVIGCSTMSMSVYTLTVYLRYLQLSYTFVQFAFGSSSWSLTNCFRKSDSKYPTLILKSVTLLSIRSKLTAKPGKNKWVWEFNIHCSQMIVHNVRLPVN